MSLKPWREIAIPHQDVLKGTFQQAEFAADLSQVHEGNATDEYQNPVLFFQRTFITEGMRLLLDSVIRRLSGRGGDPVIQLQTAFGGGKTHTMLAVYHLAKGEVSASELPGISTILDVAGITEIPKAQLVVLDGTRFSPGQPKLHEGVTVRTLWGELAWQIGGNEGYQLVAESDLNGTAPDSEILQRLLISKAPVVILIDELVAYVRQFEEGRSYSGGTFDSNLSFIQNLTQALKAVPKAMLLVSLPESKQSEAGSARGQRAMDRVEGVLSRESLEKVFGRVHALWKPVAAEEAFEIVRRRLFVDVRIGAEADSVCRAFADFYISHSEDFPRETQESRYYERLTHAYPIHPEVFDRLYEDWSSLDNFQRTRGVLKLMAKVIHRLWKDGNNDLLIMPGSLPLYDSEVRNEVIYYVPPGWDPVLERDIDGDRAETTEIENRDPRLGSVQACRRSARTIFLGSAPTTSNQVARGLEQERVHLGVAQPGQQISLYKDALHRLVDRLHYLNFANNRYWFDTRPNLRREMEERKRRFHDKEDVLPLIREHLHRSLSAGIFKGIHVFTQSSDVPDDGQLRLVVLPPASAFSRSNQATSIERAAEILKTRGDQPRQKQNRLVFLAPDYDTVSRLKDQVRSALAWKSIVDDSKELKLNLDQLQMRQADKSVVDANVVLGRMVREAYKWLLTPMQEPTLGKVMSEIRWEHFPVNAGTQNLTQEIVRVLKENEILITEWAPIHLAKLLKTWFWKEDVPEIKALDVWQKTCCYLYMPRLSNEMTLSVTIEAGTESKDFFGLAQGKDGDQYIGFTYGKRAGVILDSSLILIEPEEAASFVAKELQSEGVIEYPSREPSSDGKTAGVSVPRNHGGTGTSTSTPTSRPTPIVPVNKKRFYASIDLNPVIAKTQFNNLVDEVILQFTSRPGVNVKISIEIEAESDAGFDDGLQRTVKENCNVLQFKTAEFESGS
jgi:predicted AAA+ superfamily ATPase